MTSMRGSQHGPGNDALDALTDLGSSLPGILLVFVQRFPLHGFTVDILLQLVQAVLSSGAGPWFYWNQSDAMKRKAAKIGRSMRTLASSSHASFCNLWALDNGVDPSKLLVAVVESGFSRNAKSQHRCAQFWWPCFG
jgi:hypothetical protein